MTKRNKKRNGAFMIFDVLDEKKRVKKKHKAVNRVFGDM